ncbi:DUF1217 domain-containing protein [Amaricoccus tamworthensis]|uniref:DUF1217 domain-containing protein n=1 Tax=Amaricoccus tamworthensis TaxID=57002 RepID=UPI003C7D69C9
MYQPQIPLAGVAGWRFLERTQETQQAAFDASPELDRKIEYFREKIGSVTEVADLMQDHRLLEFSLTAFGLEEEIDKKAFIRKALEEGTDDEESFANKIVDKTYAKMSEAFGFGNEGGVQTGNPEFVEDIVNRFRDHSFQVAVGNADNNMRLALHFKQEALDLAEGGTDDGPRSWYTVLGSESLRTVFETAFGFPSQFVNLDIDRQAEYMADKARQMFGSEDLSFLSDPENVEKMIVNFLARAQLNGDYNVATGPAATALTLLQSGSSQGSSGLLNLLYGY